MIEDRAPARATPSKRFEGAISMCIYCGTHKYRKIYEHHVGPIPKDEQGRSYHIHHIDGKRSNNNLDNLIAVSLHEHYQIHLRQGDYASCLRLAKLLALDKEGWEELLRKNGEQSRQRNLVRVANGTHQFLGGEIVRKCVENGTHNFLGGEISRNITAKRLADGTHNFLGPALNNKRINDGSHNFLDKQAARNRANSRVESGIHPFVEKLTCPHCNLTGQKLNMLRYHFDNCKKSPNALPRPRLHCSHCDELYSPANFKNYHGDLCKKKPRT